jgi:hypothetical protein
MMGTPPQLKKSSQHSNAMKKSSLLAICVTLYNLTPLFFFSHIALNPVSMFTAYIIFAIELTSATGSYANDICQLNYLFLTVPRILLLT